MSQLKTTVPVATKTIRSTNEQGFLNLIELAVHILKTRPRDAATTFAVRCLVREATLKAAKKDGTRAHYISRAALHYRKIGQSENTIREHIVPVSEALKLTMEGVPSVEALAAAVEGARYVAIITKKEDRRLAEAGLKKTMPEDWDGDDVFARYHHVGITLKPCPPHIKK